MLPKSNIASLILRNTRLEITCIAILKETLLVNLKLYHSFVLFHVCATSVTLGFFIFVVYIINLNSIFICQHAYVI